MNNEIANRHPAPRSCLRVGITGGIGSGKTTVCKIFEALGVPVYYADEWAKWLITHDESLKRGIIDLLGPEAYTPEGEYNRPFVAGLVFGDKAKLSALNALVHPAVERHSNSWHEERARSGVPYTLKEAALLLESGSVQFLDALIVVTAPEDLRIRRVMQRDGIGEQQVRARMNHQMSELEKVQRADWVIVNDGVQMLLPQVWRIHKTLSRQTDAAADV